MTKAWFGAALGAAAGVAACAVGMATGCSSSSAGDAPVAESDGGLDSSAPVADAGADGSDAGPTAPRGYTLVWNIVTQPPSDAGGAGDTGATDAAVADATVSDASADGGADDGGNLTDVSADGGDAGAGPDASSPDASSANDAGAAPTVPVSGAQVCVYQMPSIPCATSNDQGIFTISGLPPLTDLALVVTKDTYRAVLRPIQTATGNMDGTANPISLQLESAAVGPDDGGALDWTTHGVVSFFAVAPLPGSDTMFGGDPGASFVISPEAGAGPYYLYDDGRYATDASALVATAGIFAEVPPGNYTIGIDDTAHDCAPILSPFGEWGYPATQLSVKFPIVAGYLTGPVGFFCTRKVALVDAGQ